MRIDRSDTTELFDDHHDDFTNSACFTHIHCKKAWLPKKMLQTIKRHNRNQTDEKREGEARPIRHVPTNQYTPSAMKILLVRLSANLYGNIIIVIHNARLLKF